MLFNFNTEPTQKYPSTTHPRKPSSKKSARWADKKKVDGGDTEEQYREGKTGYH
jgi:hypothetical protein